MIDSHPLNKPFEKRGGFWLASKPGVQVPGTLMFSLEKGIELEVQGELQHFADGNPNDAVIDCIYGALDAESCSIINVRRNGSKFYTDSLISTKYVAEYVLFNWKSHRNEMPRDMVFHATEFELTQLLFFLNLQPFKQHHGEGDEANVVRLEFRWPKTHCYDLKIPGDLRIQILGSCKYGGTGEEGGEAITYVPSISVTLKTPSDISEHLDVAWKVCSLVTLLTDEESTITSCAGSPSASTFKPHNVCFLQTVREKSDEHRIRPLIAFDVVEPIFQEILEKRLAASQTLDEAFTLLSAGRSSKGATIEGRFLLLTQSLEAFSRATTNAAYMSEEDYQKVRQAIANAIPTDLDDGHKASLKNKIKYGNEYSLRKRIALLLDSLEQETLSLIVNEKSAFIDGVVSTRNYLTHYTDELRSVSLVSEPLYWACEKLALLIRIVLLKHLGLSEGIIRSKLAEHRLSWVSQSFKGIPEVKVL